MVEETEPLGFDLTRSRAGRELLPGLTPLEASLQDALEDPAFRVSVGQTRARRQASRMTLPIRADVGITEWLTVGVTVPFVKRRSELAFLLDADTATANVGGNPRLDSPGRITDFTESMAAAIDELKARADARCTGQDATAVECREISAALKRARTLGGALSDAYGAGGLFPFSGSTTGDILTARLENLSAIFSEHGVDGFPTSLPLADGPLTREAFDGYLSDPPPGLSGDSLGTWESRWALGDVEVHGALRLLERTPPVGGDGALDGLSYLLGVGGLVRLGTGVPDAPERFMDLGSGDGQMDVEARAFGDVALGALGLWADARYGLQMEGSRTRRVAPPEAVLAPPELARQVTWTPGDYLSVEVAPRVHLTRELALAARYRFYRKGADAYAVVGADDTPGDEPLPAVSAADLEAETEETLHQAGVGLVYSTLRAARAGRARRPLEVHARYRFSPAGSGGLTPKASSIRVGLRLFWRLWGE